MHENSPSASTASKATVRFKFPIFQTHLALESKAASTPLTTIFLFPNAVLNFRKDGTPFWNLLYMAPLRDVNGASVFFCGGQVGGR